MRGVLKVEPFVLAAEHTRAEASPIGGGNMTRTAKITLWLASGLLAALFIAAGVAKFTSPVVRDHFVQWGYPDWFRALIGVLEIVSGALLLAPRLAWRAALVLGAIMLGAAITLWLRQETVQAVLPASVLLIVSIVGYARHPRATLMRRLRNAVDWVAEREMEEQRRKLAMQRAIKVLKRPARKRTRDLVNGRR
jgi:putative oxidoreductase